ncbi:MAG: hypothetical protein IPL63_14855 [Saprospiraceae bacterium]|nr:hypothetical protein [Saprospiraceae bacterium]
MHQYLINSKMRISFSIIILFFLCGNSLSQKWDIYSNIDSLSNIVRPYNYITENELSEKFNVFNFNMDKFSLENMSLLPMQLVTKDKIRLKRVPFYGDYHPFISEVYFIGKLAINDEKLSHYIFVHILTGIHTKYYLFNFYSGKIVSVLEICSNTYSIDFPEFSYRLNSEMNHSERKITLNYDYYDYNYDNKIFKPVEKVSISDKGVIRIIEKIRY